MSDQNKPESSWHLDLTVNVAMMAGFLSVAGSGIWYAATSSARLDLLEKQVAAYAPIGERVIRLESKVDTIHSSLAEIKGIVSSARPAPERR